MPPPKNPYSLVRRRQDRLPYVPIKRSTCHLQQTNRAQTEELPPDLELTIGRKAARLVSPVGQPRTARASTVLKYSQSGVSPFNAPKMELSEVFLLCLLDLPPQEQLHTAKPMVPFVRAALFEHQLVFAIESENTRDRPPISTGHTNLNVIPPRT